MRARVAFARAYCTAVPAKPHPRSHKREGLSSGSLLVSFPDPHVRPPERGVWKALLSQHVRKTGKPIRTQESKQSCDWNTARFQFQLPSVYARIGIGPYAQSTVLNYVIYVIVSNARRAPRDSFGRAHVRVWISGNETRSLLNPRMRRRVTVLVCLCVCRAPRVLPLRATERTTEGRLPTASAQSGNHLLKMRCSKVMA